MELMLTPTPPVAQAAAEELTGTISLHIVIQGLVLVPIRIPAAIGYLVIPITVLNGPGTTAELTPHADVLRVRAPMVPHRRQYMRQKVFILSGVLLLLSLGQPVAQGQVQHQRMNIPISFAADTHGVWSGGALLMVQDRFSGTPVFRTIDRNGAEISQLP